MDARITKERLGTLLSYDWLKILGVIAAAVAALYVFFTMITYRPTIAQVYTVYTYGGLRIGQDSSSFVGTLRSQERFSYDILEVEMENFDAGSLGEQALVARRGMLEGDAVFAANDAGEGEVTPFELLCNNYSAYNAETDTLRGFYNISALLNEAEDYLRTFFDDPATAADETLTGDVIAAAVEEAFYRRNGADRRFRTDAQRTAGIVAEKARILSIRANYLAVKGAIDSGAISIVPYTVEVDRVVEGEKKTEEKNFGVAIGLGKLAGLGDLFFYDSDGKIATEELCLLFFDNGYRTEEAKYENLALVNYLLDTYAPAHS